MKKSILKDPARVIDDHILNTGLKKRTVARRAGMGYDALCRSLQGRRALKAGELLGIMLALDLTLEHFIKSGQ